MQYVSLIILLTRLCILAQALRKKAFARVACRCYTKLPTLAVVGEFNWLTASAIAFHIRHRVALSQLSCDKPATACESQYSDPKSSCKGPSWDKHVV